MKNKLGKIQILFIITLIVNIFLVGGCFFLWDKIGDKAGMIDSCIKDFAVQESTKSNSYQTATLIEKEIDPANKEIMKYFIHRDNFVEFIEHIETLANKARVDVNIRSTELAESLNLGIGFEGSFNDAMYFVALIESLPINLEIDNVRIEQAKGLGLWRGWVTVMLPSSGEGDN